MADPQGSIGPQITQIFTDSERASGATATRAKCDPRLRVRHFACVVEQPSATDFLDSHTFVGDVSHESGRPNACISLRIGRCFRDGFRQAIESQVEENVKIDLYISGGFGLMGVRTRFGGFAVGACWLRTSRDSFGSYHTSTPSCSRTLTRRMKRGSSQPKNHRRNRPVVLSSELRRSSAENVRFR